jgi:iron complex outermembrane receptor protein
MKAIWQATIVSGLLWAGAVAVAQSPPATSEPVTLELDIPAQPISDALNAFAKQSGLQVFFIASEGTRNILSTPLVGTFDARSALERLLTNTGLSCEPLDAHSVAIRAEAGESPQTGTSPARAPTTGAEAGVTPSPTESVEPIRLAQTGSTTSPVGPPAAEEQVVLDEVTVLGSRSRFRVQSSAAATKIEMPLRDTPQSMTIISDELMRAASIRNTGDAADFVPGLQEAGNVNGTEVSLVSRGFDVNRDRGYKINGLVTNAEIDLDYAALERLEVVRGPASVIYGEVDYGATLNRVLKRPTPTFQAITSVEMGSFDSRRAEVDVGGPLGSSGNLGARIVGAFQDADTPIDFTNTRQVMFAPSLVWQLRDDATLSLHAYHQTIKGNYSDGFGALPDGGDPARYSIPGVSRHAYLGADFNRIDVRNRFFTAAYEQLLGGGFKLSAKAAYSDIEMDNRTSFIDGVAPDGTAPVFGFPEPKDKEDASYDLTISKAFEIGGRVHTIALSGDYRKQENLDTGSDFIFVGDVDIFDPRPIATTPGVVASLYNPDYVYIQENELSGVSLLALIKPTERLHFVGGVRYTESESLELFGTDLLTAKARDTVGRFGLVYKFTGNWSGYASWSEGIIFNALFLDVNGQPLGPERGTQTELGLKADLFSERASFAVSVFNIKRTDSAYFIDVNPDPPFNSIFGNVGRQDHRGVEIELLGEVSPNVDVIASYQYLDVEVKESADPAAIGNRPPDAPRNSASIFVNYAFPQEGLQGLALGGGVVHRSEREVDPIGSARLPAFTRIDLRASYDVSEHLFAELIAKNVTNEDILVSSFDVTANGLLYVDPRSYALRFTYQF